MDPLVVGQCHYETAHATQKLIQDDKSGQHIIVILGMNGMSVEDILTDSRTIVDLPVIVDDFKGMLSFVW